MSSSPGDKETATTIPIDEIDLSTTIGNGAISLPTCLYNASGPRSGTVEALKKVAASDGAGAVLSKSATLASQTGNPLPRIHHEDKETSGSSYNSEGLPNQGIDYYIDQNNMVEIMNNGNGSSGSEDSHDAVVVKHPTVKKPYMVSLSGKNIADNLEMMHRILGLPDEARHHISAIELNLACPNIIGKPTLAYDMDQLKDVMKQVHNKFGKQYKQQQQQQSKEQSSNAAKRLPIFGVKLPPYLDMIQLSNVADILNPYAVGDNEKSKTSGLLSYITTMNTMGNALPIDVSVQQPFIASNSGLAGLSGRALKSTAVANVWKFRQVLHDSIDVIGVGGVETGEDVIALILAGAKAVQIGTTHWTEGPACFDRIALETRTWLSEHGHSSISAVYNQLQPWSKERANQARTLRQAAAKKAKQAKEAAEAAAKTQQENAEKGSAYLGGDAQFWKLVSAVLAVIVALLCADKWHGNLLPPSE